MPPRSQLPGYPSTSAPTSPPLAATVATVDPSPTPPKDAGLEYPPSTEMNIDVPGPSSLFIPRQPSPPLPDLKRPYTHGDLSSDSDGEDEVLTTLPIYLSPSLYPHLHLFQYPLSHRSLAVPVWAEQRGKNITARVREDTGRVEVEIPVDGNGSVWREERARDLGFVTDVNAVNGSRADGIEGGVGYGFYAGEQRQQQQANGEEKGKTKKAKSKEVKWGDKVRYRSEVVPDATGYYSGIIHDGALHLHPVSKLLQLRTSLSYLDDFDARARRGPTSTVETTDASNPDGNRAKKAPSTAHLGPNPSSAIYFSTSGWTREQLKAQLASDDDFYEKDGAGSIKDFRNKMWFERGMEDLDPWVSYAWKEGEQDAAVAEKLENLLVPEEKRERLKCSTQPLEYVNRVQDTDTKQRK